MCYILKTARLTVYLFSLSVCLSLSVWTLPHYLVGGICLCAQTMWLQKRHELSVIGQSCTFLVWQLRDEDSCSQGVLSPWKIITVVGDQLVYSPSSGLDVNPGSHKFCKPEPGLDTTLPVHSGWDLPCPDPLSWRGDGSFLVSWFLLFF